MLRFPYSDCCCNLFSPLRKPQACESQWANHVLAALCVKNVAETNNKVSVKDNNKSLIINKMSISKKINTIVYIFVIHTE